MEIKSAEEIAKEIFYSPCTNGKDEESIANGVKLIKEYASQFIDLAAEEAEVYYRGHSFGDYMVDKQSILSIKELINKKVQTITACDVCGSNDIIEFPQHEL